MNSIKILFPDNQLYVSQENMRYCIRGIVVCHNSGLSRSYIQILQMVDYYNCCCDDNAELDYRMAGCIFEKLSRRNIKKESNNWDWSVDQFLHKKLIKQKEILK